MATKRVFLREIGEEVNLNLDQFCPICYDRDQVMRNVYASIPNPNKELKCLEHGTVLYEDPDLIRYKKVGEKPVEPTEPAPVVGEAVIGESQVQP